MEYAFLVQTEAEGRFKGLSLYEGCLQHTAPHGGRATIVAGVHMTDLEGQAGAVCRSLIYGQTFHLKAQLDETTVAATILNGKVSYHKGPVIIVDDRSEILQHRMRDSGPLMELIEVCSGLGGIGMGAKAAGWKVVAQNELMSRRQPFSRAGDKRQGMDERSATLPFGVVC